MYPAARRSSAIAKDRFRTILSSTERCPRHLQEDILDGVYDVPYPSRPPVAAGSGSTRPQPGKNENFCSAGFGPFLRKQSKAYLAM